MKTQILAGLAALASLAVPVLGQMQDNTQPTLNCQDNNNGNRLARHCEMREQTIAYAGQLNIDGGQNGGVSVKGWSRADVLVRSKVEASAISDTDARGLAGQVRVIASAGRIAAEGPEMSHDQNWSVSYEVFVPHQSNINVSAHNGAFISPMSAAQSNSQHRMAAFTSHASRVTCRAKPRTEGCTSI